MNRLRVLTPAKERGLEIAVGIDQDCQGQQVEGGHEAFNTEKGHPTKTGREALTSEEQVERVTGIEPA
jgi:hypothetical protein